MSHPDNPFGPFKNDKQRLEAVKVDAKRQIVMSTIDKIVPIIALIVFLVGLLLAPENMLAASGLGGIAAGLSRIIKR